MKKLFALIPALAMTLAFPALASTQPSCCNFDPYHRTKTCCPSVTIDNTSNTVSSTKTTAISNTGLNVVKGSSMPSYNRSWYSSKSSGASITTGEATAVTDSKTIAGSTGIFVTAPATGAVSIDNSNNTVSSTSTTAVANTGLNAVMGSGKITTGAAGAGSTSFSLIGTTVIAVK